MNWNPGPLRPTLPRSEVHVWRAELDGSDWPGEMELPAAERERAETMRRPLSRRRWVAARWALRRTIASYLGGAPEAIELTTDPNGKPSLAPGGSLRFNLSHSAELALIAVTTGREIGVDIERVDLDRDVVGLARHGLDPTEAAAIRAAPPAERSRAFHAAWVRREALGKCFGHGLGRPLGERPAEVSAIEVGPGWAAAVALEGVGALPIRCYGLARPPVMPTKACHAGFGRRVSAS